jgi:hypothetical protein
LRSLNEDETFSNLKKEHGCSNGDGRNTNNRGEDRSCITDKGSHFSQELRVVTDQGLAGKVASLDEEWIVASVAVGEGFASKFLDGSKVIVVTEDAEVEGELVGILGGSIVSVSNGAVGVRSAVNGDIGCLNVVASVVGQRSTSVVCNSKGLNRDAVGKAMDTIVNLDREIGSGGSRDLINTNNFDSSNSSSFSLGGFRVGGFRVGGFRVGDFRVGGFRVGDFRVGDFRVGGFRVGDFRVDKFMSTDVSNSKESKDE